MKCRTSELFFEVPLFSCHCREMPRNRCRFLVSPPISELLTPLNRNCITKIYTINLALSTDIIFENSNDWLKTFCFEFLNIDSIINKNNDNEIQGMGGGGRQRVSVRHKYIDYILPSCFFCERDWRDLISFYCLIKFCKDSPPLKEIIVFFEIFFYFNKK